MWYCAGPMPTILHEQGFQFSFFAAEGSEPPHIHVRGSGGVGKWWIRPIKLASARGFTASELSKIERIIRDNQGYFMQRWNQSFPTSER